MRGKLITFEGVEGAGKSTHAKLLADWLKNEAGLEVISAREPGGTHTGEIIRGILQYDAAKEPLSDNSEALLFCASRAQLCASVISPALERGAWVVLDRFTDSTLAYQGYGRGFDLATLRAINDFATGGLKPDLTVLIDVSLEEGFRRVAQRNTGKDRIESASMDFHRRLYFGYRQIEAFEPSRFFRVDGTMSMDDVSNCIVKEICARFGVGVQ